MQYIASFSGGKDSTAMVLMLLEKQEPLDRVVFIDTGLELPEMYESFPPEKEAIYCMFSLLFPNTV